MSEISINEIGPIRIGQVENVEAATGCTVFIAENGMRAGVDVRGGGPSSRETQVLNPLMNAEEIHAVLLGGGSAFGLEAANGVMKYLEERGFGYDVGITKVPIVAQSDIFDLTVGECYVRPDVKMGYEAAKNAFENPNYADGNYGAGCGASVGKIMGMDYAMKTGIGSYAISVGDLRIGAVSVVNALGDIFDWKTGKQIAGLLAEDKLGLRSTVEYMKENLKRNTDKFTGNTTISIVITNAGLSKAELCKVAGVAHNGYARSINPVHSSADGDSIYAVSIGDVDADKDLVGTLAAEVISEAIIRAVDSAESAYGLPGRKELDLS